MYDILNDPTIESINIFIHSSDRSNGTRENFRYIVGQLPIYDVIAYRINRCVIPNSDYLISQGFTNSLILDDGGGPTSVIIPEGYYNNTTSLMTTIKNGLDTASSIPQVYTVTNDFISGKTTISSVAPFTITFDSALSQIIGFGSVGTVLSGTNSYLSSEVYNPDIVLTIFVVSDLLANSTLAGNNVEHHSGSSKILALPKPNVSVYSDQVLEFPIRFEFESDGYIYKTRPISLYDLDLRLEYDTVIKNLGRNVDLHGKGWFISFTFFYRPHKNLQ